MIPGVRLACDITRCARDGALKRCPTSGLKLVGDYFTFGAASWAVEASVDALSAGVDGIDAFSNHEWLAGGISAFWLSWHSAQLPTQQTKRHPHSLSRHVRMLV